MGRKLVTAVVPTGRSYLQSDTYQRRRPHEACADVASHNRKEGMTITPLGLGCSKRFSTGLFPFILILQSLRLVIEYEIKSFVLSESNQLLTSLIYPSGASGREYHTSYSNFLVLFHRFDFRYQQNEHQRKRR